LQGGGPAYNPGIYDNYVNSAFDWDGSLKPRYFDRLQRILDLADQIGMVVILNYFYWQQSQSFIHNDAIRKATRLAAEWILENRYQKVLVDINNEVKSGKGILESEGIHELIETPPINWGINTDFKKIFFNRVKTITGI
jgi:hypothetical protein